MSSQSGKRKILSDEAVLLTYIKVLISERVSLNLSNTARCPYKKNKYRKRKEMMKMEKKMTKKEMFGRLIEIVEGAGVTDTDVIVEFLNHEIELVSKKRSGQTKTQKENEVLVETIYDALKDAEKAMTITELYEVVKSDEIKSSQKVSALVKKLVDAGRVVRTEDKKRAYFSIAE